ncbi:isochorismate synthase DhbC [Paenibacillus larvae]|uniref:isochorismate synthase n=1 Tax=Paenibacillus larvae TaxID=1464 RepID=A0AAP5JWR3_9BACL|nr:isochorismate synthase DhbC [Paenibacillus larvae]AVF21952.1 isochorismate synthase DhbC [Paenibacillus larvae subsp. larvae]ETK27270.1 isochorismate synthase DhbC [Paenibacillus larvae subsp. larvae DSM 25719]MCY7477950.1 isochorismate synthase DhbC [Paenibacillus larvae]MCY7488598.1 isochorismate synthase DhbC [Paenibacillus larvae]MCY9563178.1 isochorismate synthase DhbC [Paenibacillus larvae]
MDHTVSLEESAIKLLNEYKAGSSFFLASPYQTLLAKGTYATVSHTRLENLSELVTAVLGNAEQAGHRNPVVVGAVPFDQTNPVQLVVPEEIRWAVPLQFDSINELQHSVMSTYEIKAVPEPAEYVRGVEKGVARIKGGDLSKIVLSRSLKLSSSKTIDIPRLLRNLARQNSQGYTFAVDLPEYELDKGDISFISKTQSHRTLIGASPELLVSRSGLQVVSNPLAGSRPRSKDANEDKRRAQELLSSAKDRHEHAVVVEAVAAALRPYCRILDVPAEPSLIHTETMWHLSTEIKGELADPATSVFELAASLHPTPAVCGSPTEAARAAIREIEPFDRGFFTGMIGWCDSNGDGEWVVSIRCAEVLERSLRLFAGAGVVSESRAEDELAETSAKFRTMLLAMGLNNEQLE